jgi:hypothetical protein
MRARLELDILLAYQAEISLVDESGGLEGVILALPAHIGVGEPVQLIVDKGKELLERRFVAVAPIGKEARDFALG